MTGSYLTQARVITADDATVTVSFDASQGFIANYLQDSEQLELLRSTARELLGRSVEVRVLLDTPVAVEPKPEKKSGNIDDPVLKSLSKHLGGEVATPRAKRSEA